MMWHFLSGFVPLCSSRFSPTAPVTLSKAKRRKLGGDNKNLDSGLNVSQWSKQYSKLAVGTQILDAELKILICFCMAAVIYQSQMSVSPGSQRSEENHHCWPLEMFWLLFNRLWGGKHLWHLFNTAPARVANFGTMALRLCCAWLLLFYFTYFLRDNSYILFWKTVYSAIVILLLSLLLRC